MGANLEAIGPVLGALRKSQSKIVSLTVQAIAEVGKAASIPIAAFLSQTVGCQVDSALTRLYRLLHNPRLDDLKITRQMLSVLSQAHSSLVIALDWTEWRVPLRMLLASVVVGARAIPVYAAAFSKTDIPRSQNTRENAFLRVLGMILEEVRVKACFLADRGFRRVSFLNLLLKQEGHSFLVRIGDQVMVENKKGKRLLKRWGLQPGMALDLGVVRLRQDGAATCRVVGIWAKGQREPWWLATNLCDPLSRLAALYDRRMAIEQQIRDTKGARFGFALVQTQIQKPEALARFALLIGLAIMLLTAIGCAVALRRPDVRLTSKAKGHRLSLLSVGRLFFHSFLKNQKLSLDLLLQNLPPPTLRSFDWLNSISEEKEK